MDRIGNLLATFKPLFPSLFTDIEIADVDISVLREIIEIYDGITVLNFPTHPGEKAKLIRLLCAITHLKRYVYNEDWGSVLATLPCMVDTHAS